MITTSRTIQLTLAFVNRLRAQQGRKPLQRMPKGQPGSRISCPIAVALRFNRMQSSVTESYIDFPLRNGPSKTVGPMRIPQYVKDFIGEYDRRNIPELIRQ